MINLDVFYKNKYLYLLLTYIWYIKIGEPDISGSPIL